MIGRTQKNFGYVTVTRVLSKMFANCLTFIIFDTAFNMYGNSKENLWLSGVPF